MSDVRFEFSNIGANFIVQTTILRKNKPQTTVKKFSPIKIVSTFYLFLLIRTEIVIAIVRIYVYLLYAYMLLYVYIYRII